MFRYDGKLIISQRLAPLIMVVTEQVFIGILVFRTRICFEFRI
jgi:hypothetical protein